ncbi:hypothetical protein BD289DRAFT_433066, partial [Coniella lustricola]
FFSFFLFFLSLVNGEHPWSSIDKLLCLTELAGWMFLAVMLPIRADKTSDWKSTVKSPASGRGWDSNNSRNHL